MTTKDEQPSTDQQRGNIPPPRGGELEVMIDSFIKRFGYLLSPLMVGAGVLMVVAGIEQSGYAGPSNVAGALLAVAGAVLVGCASIALAIRQGLHRPDRRTPSADRPADDSNRDRDATAD